MAITVDIVSAAGSVFHGEAQIVFAPAELGEMGILHGHAPLLARLKPGDVRVRISDNEQLHFYVSGGIIEVQPETVTVLADTAIRAEDLDEAAILEAKARAENEMQDKTGRIDYARVQAQLVELASQLRTLDRLRQTKR